MNLPLNIDFQQILLHMFNFVLLFGGMYFILYKPVKKFMDMRTEKIRQDIENAQSARSEAERFKAEYEQKLDSAEETARRITEQAEEQARAYTDVKIRQTQTQADALLAEARVSAEAEKQRIVRSASHDIAEMATEATKKIVYNDPTEAYDGFMNSLEGKA